jgi:hypothetical protein
MSHQQTPFDHTTTYAAVARSGKVALLAFPLGQGYYNQGFWAYRQAFQKALVGVFPTPLIQTDAHLTTELSLTHQAANPADGPGARNGTLKTTGGRDKYWLGSLFTVKRKAPESARPGFRCLV